MDRAGASSAAGQIAVADAWWAVANTETGPAQLAMKRRAASWYRLALQSDGVSGIQRVLLEKRIAELPVKHEAVIDLLAQVNLARDTARGTFQVTRNGLAKKDGHATLVLPIEPAAGYELSVAVTRDSGGKEITLILPTSGGRSTQVLVGGGGGQNINVAGVKVLTMPGGPFTNKRRHTVVVEVNPNGGRVRLTVTFDGVVHFDWTGQLGDLGEAGDFGLKDHTHAAIDIHEGSSVTLHAINYRSLPKGGPEH